MYAVVRTGGKQVRVEPEQSVRIEKIEGEVGGRIELSDVLLISNEGNPRVGMPLVDGAKVLATITKQARAPKVTIFKKKRRKGYRHRQGHRQYFTEIRIDKIEG